MVETNWFTEPPEEVVVGYDYAGREIYDGDMVYESPDGDIIVEEGLDDYLSEYVSDNFRTGYYERGGIEYD